MFGNLMPTGLYSPYSTYSPYFSQFSTGYAGGYGSVWRLSYENRLMQGFGQGWPLVQEPRFGLNQSFYSQRFSFQRGMF